MRRVISGVSARLQGSLVPRSVGVLRDGWNRLYWGPGAPRFAERIHVDPRACRDSLRLGSQTVSSGRVVRDAGRFSAVRPTREEPLIAGCLRHWVKGVDWDGTGLPELVAEQVRANGVQDRCRSVADVRARYQRLDGLFDAVRDEGRLKCRTELGGWREMGGILIHVGADGRLYFGGNGNHRLALALALGLESIPAQLGTIHVDALEQLPDLRRGSAGGAAA